ncbi:MAG: hypothetical protein A4E32_01545 [Methanomassiliicoccales archaeon PtaU1.Bin124]|nr:MAG: hypothetical protein A4E32_01545 [Methanomassiliicoccales archaeon PtaU1.Bin124]
MTTSTLAEEYIGLWREDLRRKGFTQVEIAQGQLTFISALRPDGRRFRGFAAFEPLDLDLKLRQGLEDAVKEGCMTFLVTSYDLMENARSTIKQWGFEKKVQLESVM